MCPQVVLHHRFQQRGRREDWKDGRSGNARRATVAGRRESSHRVTRRRGSGRALAVPIGGITPSHNTAARTAALQVKNSQQIFDRLRYGSGFEDAPSTGDADPDGGTGAAPVAGVAEAEPVGVAKAAGLATGAGFCWAESLSAKLPASRDAIPAAVLSGNLCTMLS